MALFFLRYLGLYKDLLEVLGGFLEAIEYYGM